MNIYLSGGFKTGWQDEVIETVRRLRPDAEIFDPRDNKLHDPALYTAQDLKAIRECDIMICFIEATNPSGLNLAFELGYAHALGKKTLLVNQKGERWAEMLHQVSESFGDMPSVLTGLPFIEEFLGE